MNQITSDEEFRKALQDLNETQQGVIAAKFVEHVLSLSTDERVGRVVKVAADESASQDELAAALKSAKAAAIESYTRCGSEGDWTEQAGYFVARAAVAAVTPQAQAKKNPVWSAAMSSRMARTSMLIDDEQSAGKTHSENEWQYDTLSEYLQS
ncbi:hypothetical protein [Solemya velum gill symbiont]|uniref:hypothetical protein n=1 Tax=Solemya velum gill symbiont TaxID=2340 RepID=UPI0009976121|nr:hypothetical protein [Solemya velum gill symbiont]OOZ44225.1 hypothetical protein BOW37_07525 [Solemya velum gill symbiont]OOZ47989.1 hypothetical protein BOW38_00545 [Solemya velum gill symbiont]OOZ51075.1 hypothetical protein BOW39_00195 [Solemya velum gill symbiont]OOZ52932.1 hypothetical protein BOW40_00550 [Solemya velum gill symbiont]OOZ56199.1 hypothetical protein BOW41_00550 [Solemya velum gill symbiont]